MTSHHDHALRLPPKLTMSRSESRRLWFYLYVGFVGLLVFVINPGMNWSALFSVIGFVCSVAASVYFWYNKVSNLRADREAWYGRAAWKVKLGSLSRIGEFVYHAYFRLPEEHRPYGDIFSMISDLDTTHGGSQRVDGHFGYINPNTGLSSVRCTGGSRIVNNSLSRVCELDCTIYPEYQNMLNEIQAVQAVVKEKERILAEKQRETEVRGAAAGVESFNEVLAGLRAEREVLVGANKIIRKL